MSFFEGESGKTLIAMLAIITVCGGPIFAIGWGAWLKHRQKELDADLKREMIERGMSADEIVRVLEAKTGQTSSSLGKTGTKQHS
jgi:hypothetical protein